MRLVEPAGLRRLARVRHIVLQTPDAKHFDARAQGPEVGVRNDGRLEALERHVPLAQAEKRLAPADKRGNVSRIGDDRPIEVSRGVVEILLGQRDVAQANLRRVERP